MMEITTTYPKQTTLATQVTSPDHKKIATAESDKGSEKSGEIVTEDSVLLSKEALKLAEAAASQGAGPTLIENGAQALQAVERLVSDVGNNPGLVLQIQGNVSKVNFNLLLD